MLFKNRPRKKSPVPLPSTDVQTWTVREWSRQSARGVAESRSGAQVAFDASVCTVDDLRVGEAVTLRLDPTSRRVLEVAPSPPPTRVAHLLSPTIEVVESNLLDVRLDMSAEERAMLEERFFEAYDVPYIHRESGFVSLESDYRTPSYAEKIRAFLATELGRPVEALVRVAASYPFRWRPGDERALLAIYQTLPGFVLHDGMISFFGTDPGCPPYLDTSFEQVGLEVNGTVRRADWRAWSGAFERRANGVFTMREM